MKKTTSCSLYPLYSLYSLSSSNSISHLCSPLGVHTPEVCVPPYTPYFFAISPMKGSSCMKSIKSHHVLLVVAIVAALLIFHFRLKLRDRFSTWRSNRTWARLPGFQDDLDAGFSSNTFDINTNIANNDPRTLDENAKEAIRKLMLEHNLTFDEARLRYFRDHMSANGVGPNGVPMDPKTVTFS